MSPWPGQAGRRCRQAAFLGPEGFCRWRASWGATGNTNGVSCGLYVRDDPIVAKGSTVWWPGGLHYYWPAPDSLKACFASTSAGLARARDRGHRQQLSDPMAFPPIPRDYIIR